MTGQRRIAPAAMLACSAILVMTPAKMLWPTPDCRSEETTKIVPLVDAEASYAIGRIEAKFGKPRGVSVRIDKASNSIYLSGDESAIRVLRDRLKRFERDMPQGINVYRFRHWSSALLCAATIESAAWFPPLSEDDTLKGTVDWTTDAVIFRARGSSAEFISELMKWLGIDE